MSSTLQRATTGTRTGRIVVGLLVLAGVALLTVLATRGTDAPPLEDGEHFGFVSSVTSTSLVVDPAAFLTGDEARDAAIEDGELAEGEELPNGFYVRDVAPGSTEIPLAERFSGEVLDNVSIAHRPAMDASALAELFAGEADTSWVYDSLERLPMTLTVEDGEVVRAVQQYLP